MRRSISHGAFKVYKYVTLWFHGPFEIVFLEQKDT